MTSWYDHSWGVDPPDMVQSSRPPRSTTGPGWQIYFRNKYSRDCARSTIQYYARRVPFSSCHSYQRKTGVPCRASISKLTHRAHRPPHLTVLSLWELYPCERCSSGVHVQGQNSSLVCCFMTFTAGFTYVRAPAHSTISVAQDSWFASAGL
jgi:hypothetical protein